MPNFELSIKKEDYTTETEYAITAKPSDQHPRKVKDLDPDKEEAVKKWLQIPQKK